MPSIKEQIESNIVVWMLGTLLTGFVAGIGTYKSALEIMDLKTISQDRLNALEKLPTLGVDSCNSELPLYLGSSEMELIFTKIKSAYNDKNFNSLYQLLGPIRRAQLTLETAKLQIEPTFQSLGEMQGGFFVGYQFMGKQGLYKLFMLNFSVKYEKAEKGIASITVIDDGKSYQIDGIMFNRL